MSMRLIYVLSYRDKEATHWFQERAFNKESEARLAKIAAEQEDGKDFDYKVTQLPFVE